MCGEMFQSNEFVNCGISAYEGHAGSSRDMRTATFPQQGETEEYEMLFGPDAFHLFHTEFHRISPNFKTAQRSME